MTIYLPWPSKIHLAYLVPLRFTLVPVVLHEGVHWAFLNQIAQCGEEDPTRGTKEASRSRLPVMPGFLLVCLGGEKGISPTGMKRLPRLGTCGKIPPACGDTECFSTQVLGAESSPSSSRGGRGVLALSTWSTTDSPFLLDSQSLLGSHLIPLVGGVMFICCCCRMPVQPGEGMSL